MMVKRKKKESKIWQFLSYFGRIWSYFVIKNRTARALAADRHKKQDSTLRKQGLKKQSFLIHPKKIFCHRFPVKNRIISSITF